MIITWFDIRALIRPASLRRHFRRPVLLIMTSMTVAMSALAACAPSNAPSTDPATSTVRDAVVTTDYDEPYRPQYHFSPAKNWMNDPNGLIYLDGEYHLFFQYNPEGATWGNMSWGHAVSTDLVHWKEQPIAIEGSAAERIFSGSVVVDRDNTSGFGQPGRPAMVAVYTSWYESGSRHQAQSLAYSLDRGRTWTKFADNPVLTAEQDGKNPQDFRDPKVFWYAPQKKWVMVLALSADHRIAVYSSTDLRTWRHLSDFGPAGATGGVWECPDLFELPVDGDPSRKKWVLSVNLSPGSIAGGSGAQYFVGDFNGTTFTADDTGPYVPPAGRSLADFEGDTYGAGWTTTGTAFDSGPASGTLARQNPVSGFAGHGLVNSFSDGDGPTGTLTSPPFTIDADYLNFLVGGGHHADTVVNLLVDGQVVRHTSGADNEVMDWTAWDLVDLRGQRAQLQLVDGNSGGWGHILADQFTLADSPARSSTGRARWQDFGADYYAAVTWNDVPDGRRLAIGWMNNWLYANEVPTAPWRSISTLPRELTLKIVGGRIDLVQRPVPEVNALQPKASYEADAVRVPVGTTGLDDPGARGQSLRLDLRLDVGDSSAAGVRVRTGPGEQMVIGYDTRRQELYLDRRGSGQDGFSPEFAKVARAPLALPSGGLKLQIYVDRSSVEVFADQGQVTLTDQIFPAAGSTGVELFADGGAATVNALRIFQLPPIW
jgi:sucrose-6-phosphate hydrolase SacC (GH32 family)